MKQPDRGRRRTVTPSTSRGSQLRDQLADDQLSGEPRGDRVHVMIVNFSHDVIELPKACFRRGRRNL
jgi:hypothetical protein